nr:SGNH hydrolase domain-containing protein [Prochlorococcus marinus]
MNIKSLKFLVFGFVYFLCIIFPNQFFFFKNYKYPFFQKVFNYGNKISPWQNPYFQLSNKGSKQVECENLINLKDLYLKSDNSICTSLNLNAKARIFVIGDSHSANHVQSILYALEKKSIKNPFNSLVEFRINPLAGRKRDIWTNIREYEEKKEYESLLKFLQKNLRSDDIVIFSTERDDVIKNKDKNKKLPRETDFYLLNNLEKQLNNLKNITLENKTDLILVDAVPKPCQNSEYYLINVVKNGNFSDCKVSREASLIDRENLSKVYKKIAKSRNVKYVDFHSFLCPDNFCSLTNPNRTNTLLYVDTSPHFYFKSNKVLYKNWKEILKRYIVK